MPAKKKPTARVRSASRLTARSGAAPTPPKGPARPSQFATPAGGPWGQCFLPRGRGERRYWLVKSEPAVFSWEDLRRAPGRTTHWDGVRNFAARNFLRDGMKKGDLVFYYHSNATPQAIHGLCEVVREGYPDHTAFDPAHDGFDGDSSPDAPTWYMVDLRAVEPLAQPVTLAAMKATKALAQMALIRTGRLSVIPVTAAEWTVVLTMARG